MLEVGPYPYYLKQRVLGDRGHLSNELSGRLLCDILHNNLQSVLLGHLSKENNYEELAYETVRLEVTLGQNPYKGDEIPIAVAKKGSGVCSDRGLEKESMQNWIQEDRQNEEMHYYSSR